MRSNGMSLRMRFLLGMVACAVLPLVIASLVGYRGLMTCDRAVQKHLDALVEGLLAQAPEDACPAVQEGLAAAKEDLRALTLRMRKLIIISSTALMLVIVVAGICFSRVIAGNKPSAGDSEAESGGSADFEKQLEKMRATLGRFVDEVDEKEP